MSLPIIFLTFANNAGSSGTYLRKLNQEKQKIRKALDRASAISTLKIEDNTSIEDIIDVFEAGEGLIKIFHFAGHANQESILLQTVSHENQQFDGKNLAHILASFKSLKIVFLNGCLTEKSAQLLNEAGIPLVIGTVAEVEDGKAAELAELFYSGLGKGFDVEQAWRIAENTILGKNTTRGEYNYRGLYRELGGQIPQQFPWKLYIRPGSETVLHWNLPQEAKNPLISLPEIDREYYYHLPEAPYLGLQTFRKKHAALFFGRGEAIRELYNKLKGSAPIILYSGPSGVGKSSLLEAGLEPRLEQEYEIELLRREGLLHKTLLKGLAHDVSLDKTVDLPVLTLWLRREVVGKKPFLLILDQLEEVYTKPGVEGPEKELNAFAKALSQVFEDPNQRPQGKIILAYREEYSARIEQFLRMHQLPYITVFLTPLDREGMIEAITGIDKHPDTKNKYGLIFDDRVADLIANGLSADTQSSQAPILQILLERMWRVAIEQSRPPIFSEKLYTEQEKKGYLLKDFLQQQFQTLETSQKEVVQSGLALDVLFFFTTALGTAETRTKAETLERYAHRREVMENSLQELVDLRLLQTVDKGQLKLSHDLLSPLIRKMYEESGLPGQLASRVLANKAGMKEVVLDDVDLKIVDAGMGGRQKGEEAEQKLIQESKKQQVRRQKAARNRWRVVIGSGLVAFLLAIVALFLWQDAEQKRISAVTNLMLAKAREVATEDFSHAVGLLKEAYNLHKGKPPVEVEKLMAELIYSHQYDALSTVEIANDGSAEDIQFNEGEGHVLTWSRGNEVALWDQKGDKLVEMPHHYGQKGALFCKNQKAVLSWGKDGWIKLWDYSGIIKRQFHDSSEISQVVLSKDEKVAAYITQNGYGHLKVWDLEKGVPIFDVPAKQTIKGVILNPVYSELLLWTEHGSFQVWDYLRDSLIASFTVKSWEPFSKVRFNDDGEKILSWGKTGYSLVSRAGESIQDFFPPKNIHLLNVSFSVHKDKILACANNGKIYYNGKQAADYTQNSTFRVNVNVSPDEKKVVVQDQGNVLVYTTLDTLWLDPKLIKGNNWKEEQSPIKKILWSRDSKYILLLTHDGRVQIWDLKGELRVQTQQKGTLMDAFFDPSQMNLLTWSLNGSIKKWDCKSKAFTSEKLKQYSDGIFYLSNSPKGVVGVVNKDSLVFWDNKGNLIHSIKGKKGVNYANWIENTNQLLVGYEGKSLELLDLKQKSFKALNLKENILYENNQHIALLQKDKKVVVWNVLNNVHFVWPLPKNINFIDGATFSNDLKYSLTYNFETDTAYLWDRKGQALNIFHFNSDIVYAVFSNDERFLAICDAEGNIAVWSFQEKKLYHFKEEIWTNQIFFESNRPSVLTYVNDDHIKLAILNPEATYDIKLRSLSAKKIYLSDDGKNIYYVDEHFGFIQKLPLPSTYYEWLKQKNLGNLPQNTLAKYLKG